MAATCALSARPDPVTAALTSLGVCRATGMPRRAAASTATPRGLRRAHHRADVVLAEDPLDGDDVRAALLDPALDGLGDAEQAAGEVARSAGVRTTSTATSATRPAGPALDDADTAPGQAGVDAEHAHGGIVAVRRPGDRRGRAVRLHPDGAGGPSRGSAGRGVRDRRPGSGGSARRPP